MRGTAIFTASRLLKEDLSQIQDSVRGDTMQQKNDSEWIQVKRKKERGN